jgi:hypothetical protein
MLVLGEGGELSQEHDFDLKVQPGAFTLEYLTEEIKEQRRRRFERLIEDGEQFLTGLDRKDWDDLYRRHDEWTTKVSAFLSDTFGLRYSEQFDGHIQLETQPSFESELPERRDFLRVLHTRVFVLKGIAEKEA